jgi:transglutaminase-like putative cysteine protease
LIIFSAPLLLQARVTRGFRMRACPRLIVCILLLVSTTAWGQAPIITSAGDPSVKNDTLYRLAVSPADYPSELVVLLLDDGVVRYEADGTGFTTYRQVIQILSPDAVDDYAEHEFSYAPGHQQMTVNWIRVVRPDGTVVSEAPTQVQDADVPATLGDPVYTDAKVRRYSLSGVAPGTIVDWSYTIEERKPFLPGDFSLSWSVHTGRVTRLSRYLVDLPASFQPRIIERNLTFSRQEAVTSDRRTYVWATRDVPRVQGEDFMADSNGVFMSIELAAPLEWASIGRWYAGLSRDRYALSADIKARLPLLLEGARSSSDTLRAIQRWVAQDVRYVSIALGLGGYQPRLPAEVVSTGYGDCKDKATLFIATVAALGFQAYPVLLNSGSPVERSLPSMGQFDHAIAAVDRPEGRLYVDLTADLAPLGELPAGVQGQFALVVHPDGTSEEVTLPQAEPGANLQETRIVGTLSHEGYITASYEERGLGTRQYSLRQLFLTPIDSTHRADLARSIATKLYPGAVADSLQIFDGRDLTADTRIALRISRGLAARPAGTGRTVILTLPFSSMRSMADAAAALEAKGPRKFPIDAAKVVGPIAGQSDIRLALPPGWRVQLPPSVNVTGKWGSYVAHYAQTGTTLHVSRRIEGARGIHPPDAVADLAAWLRAIGQDDVPYLVIEPGQTP